MEEASRGESGKMPAPEPAEGEASMVRKQLWEEIRRQREQEGATISELARDHDLDRKTVRRCIRGHRWEPYRRTVQAERILGEHEGFVLERAPQVGYSARILYQELVSKRGYRGSYDTVKLFVRPLRQLVAQAERTQVRFETPPGEQSQVDWGQARLLFGARPVEVHLFVLTLGYSRRSFYCAMPNEKMAQFLEAHERAFEYFGGHTREHLYDRPRTVCLGGEGGKVRWNPTFKAFADYWGFEPRLCAPYRAKTKGKVESGVKYVKRNFLPGRSFVDDRDFDEQLCEWMATVADVRVHGTTHEKPLERFARERGHLIPTCGQPSFRLEAKVERTVGEDYLVAYRTNRYSVPFRLIGKLVEVLCRGQSVEIYYRGGLVATHPLLEGSHQVRILPEHGPGAIARNARLRRSTAAFSKGGAASGVPEVEQRDLSVYESLLKAEGRGEVAP